ncbi:MAG: hypothetical protein ACO1RT_17530 [Planctomycetaceae bacterium]
MPSLKCPHCRAITEFTAVSDNQTIACEHCGKTVRVKESVRSPSASGSPASAENVAISDRPKAVAAKPEPAKTSAASKNALPDFAAIATAAASSSPAAALPDFAGLNIKTRPSETKKATSKSPATVAEGKDAVTPQPAEVAIKQPKSAAETDKKADKGLTKELPRALEKPQVLGKPQVLEKPQAVEKSQAAEKKPSEPVNDLAGFREFAAIVGSASSPAVPIVADTESSSRSPEVVAVADSAAVDKLPAPKSGSVSSREKSVKAGRLFGQAWIPALVDASAWLLFATAIYVIYAVATGAVNAVAGVAIAVALVAAGVMMLALALGVRLLMQMAADSSARSRAE